MAEFNSSWHTVRFDNEKKLKDQLRAENATLKEYLILALMKIRELKAQVADLVTPPPSPRSSARMFATLIAKKSRKN